MTGGATISDCGHYRYRLWRDLAPTLGQTPKIVAFVMLNPSTADANNDDPTIRRCLGFAEREGATKLDVVNLFGLRATDPQELTKYNDPVGPDNERYVTQSIAGADLTICAWGVRWREVDQRHFYPGSARLHVEGIAERLGKPLHCLNYSKDGDPVHPLYQPKDVPLKPFPRPES